MELQESLSRFVESSSSDWMPAAASELLDLMETDAVEPLNTPGRALPAEDVAERLEQKCDKIRRKLDTVDGLDLIEDVVAHLRANDSESVEPWTFEDGDGIRWFVLADAGDVVACYTSRPFLLAEM